ncbi:MAG: inverse autotransporter beta domain-containing protein [Phormidesmis sp.]
MKHSVWHTVALLLFQILFITPAKAKQAVKDALIVRSRFGVDFDTAGSGADAFGQFEGFVPIWQQAGRDLLFFQGQLLLDVNANLGTNLQLGYRRYMPASQRIYGGYVAFDKRGTDAASFNQLGIGLETLGRDWDLRLNGYLPVGDRRQLINSNSLGEGTQFSDVQFIDHQIFTTRQPQQSTARQYESALGGVDLEVGTRLLAIGTEGVLRGFGGLYYYDGPGVDGSLGWRLGLRAEPTEYLRTGLSVQDDGIFGTSVRFSIGATLPSYRTRSQAPASAPVKGSEDDAGTEANSLLARMSESVNRVGYIIVDRQTEVETLALGDSQRGAVINPATGQPWFFSHVTPDAAGEGTFEMPYGEIDQAIATIPTDGNGIIYVGESGDTTFFGPFNVPGGVQLLSTGPEQFIAAFDSDTRLQLPASGSGNLPFIDGIVNLGSSPLAPTVFAGFDVQNFGFSEGIENDFSNNSLFLNSLEADSLTPDSLERFDNESGYGIFADNSLGEVIIRDNVVSSSNTGIYTDASDSDTAGGLTITRNTISGPQRAGIRVDNEDVTLTGDINISDNSITSEYGGGILTFIEDSSLTGDITINNNNVEASYFGIGVGAQSSTISGNIAISDNSVETSSTYAGGGIAVGNINSTVGSGVTITGNTVDTQTVGIGVINYGASRIEGGVTISGNSKIQVSGDAEYNYLVENFLGGAAGIVVGNGGGSTIAGGVNISANGPIQVTADDETSALGILVGNAGGQIEGGVTINSNESIEVSGATIDPITDGPPSPGNFGTTAVAVVNFSTGAASAIDGGVTISGNTDIGSNEYGITIINRSNPFNADDGITGDIVVSGNIVDAGDDALLVTNTDEIDGSVALLNNMLKSLNDDGIDFTNLTPSGRVSGDVVFSDNTIDAGGDDIKCVNTGTIDGSEPPECQN